MPPANAIAPKALGVLGPGFITGASDDDPRDARRDRHHDLAVPLLLATSNEVEEEKAAGRTWLRQREGATPTELRHSALDVTAGMAFSNAVMSFIILSTGLTLYPSGQTDIATGADAGAGAAPGRG